MRIFITGGTGFIGRHTAAELARRGHRLLLLTRKSNPKELFKSRRNVAFVRGDTCDVAAWSSRVKRFKPDVVLHMAWEGIPDFSSATSIKNLKNGLDLIRFAASLPCKKLVCAGSLFEYGISVGKADESMGLQPMSAFSAAKTALHWIGREIAKENGIQFVWTRIFFAYGPGQRQASLIPYLMSCVRSGASPEIRNIDGANDFVYVDDVARALAMIVEKRSVKNNLYNIASGRLTTVRDIVNLVYGRVVSGRPPKENSGYYADISRIKKDIGWSPKVDIKNGIKKTAAYYRNSRIKR